MTGSLLILYLSLFNLIQFKRRYWLSVLIGNWVQPRARGSTTPAGKTSPLCDGDCCHQLSSVPHDSTSVIVFVSIWYRPTLWAGKCSKPLEPPNQVSQVVLGKMVVLVVRFWSELGDYLVTCVGGEFQATPARALGTNNHTHATPRTSISSYTLLQTLKVHVRHPRVYTVALRLYPSTLTGPPVPPWCYSDEHPHFALVLLGCNCLRYVRIQHNLYTRPLL